MQFRGPLKKVQIQGTGRGAALTGAMGQRTPRGATLIELLITVGVFSFLVVSLLAITRDGTASWRSVETRSSVQTALRMAEREITTELIRASYSSVKIKQDTYQHAIVFKSAMNDTDVEDTGVLGDPMIFWLEPDDVTPKYQRYVLYYVTRIDDDEHLATYGFKCDTSKLSAGPPYNDDVCPHKILVRKDIYLAAALDSKSALGSSPYIESPPDEPSTLTQYANVPFIWAEPSLKSQYPYLAQVRIIARDVLSFNLAPVKPDGSPGTLDSNGGLNSGNSAFLVEFDIKTFKTLEAAGSVTIGGSDLSQSQFTVQLDNRVMPGNS